MESRRNNMALVRRGPRRGAFTLIELLITIAVAVILMATLLPTLSRSRDAARMAICRNQLNQLGTAAHNYAVDHNGMWCIAMDPSAPSNLTIWTGSADPPHYVHYGRLIPEYLTDSGAVFYCPSSEAITADDPNVGWAKIGKVGPDKEAIGAYWQRGIPRGAPKTNEEEGRIALATDQIGFKKLDANHEGATNTLYYDGSVITFHVPDGWSAMSYDGAGGDGFDPGTGDWTIPGAWTQLDRKAPE